MEGDELHPTVGDDNVHRFDAAEVLSLVRARSAGALAPSAEGERDARIFEMLGDGKELREIVTTLRLPVDVVVKLSGQWAELGRRDVVVPPVRRAELEQCLGRIGDAAELTQLVRSVAADRDRLDTENETTRNRINNVLSLLGEIAARSPELAQSLPALKMELEKEQIELLDRVSHYFQQTQSGSAGPLDAPEHGRGVIVDEPVTTVPPSGMNAGSSAGGQA